MIRATIVYVAGRTRAREGALLNDSHVASKRTLNETANTPLSSGATVPASTPTLRPAMKALQAGRGVSKGKSLDLMKGPPSTSSSSSSTSEELDSDERETKAKRGRGSKRAVRKSEAKSKIKPAVK